MDDRTKAKIGARCELARRFFFDYCCLKSPDFYKPDRKFLKELCDTLQAFSKSKKKVLLVDLPPRHGKSRTLQLFVEWSLGHDHRIKIMTGSYNDTLSTVFAKGVRNSIQEIHVDDERPVYSDIFPDTRIKTGDGAMNMWSLEDGYNNYLATSPKGTATGFGCNCLPAGTKVLTNYGEMDISDIFHSTKDIRTLSLCHKNGIIRYNKILAKRSVVSNDIFEITTENGKRIQCTGNHQIFTEECGYIPAREVKAGQTAKTIQGCVCDLRSAESRTGKTLHGLLPKAKGFIQNLCLQVLWQDIHPEAIRNRQGAQKRVRGQLLFKRLQLQGTGRSTKNKLLRDLWKTCEKNEKKILFGRVRKDSKREQENTKNLCFLRKGILRKFIEKAILFDGVQEQSTFGQYDGNGQFTFHTEQEFQQGICRHPSADFGQRQTHLSEMRCNGRSGVLEGWQVKDEDKPCGSPYRRESKEQRTEQPDNTLWFLPFKSASQEKIISVKQISKEVEVYDIQVDRDNNFFANSILVHNCMIIDDLIKNADEAHNESILQSHWDWFTNTMYSRLEEGGKIIVVMTRWATNDFAGRILAHFGDAVEHINIPAVQPDGSMLCDEILSKESCEEKKRAMGIDIWSANYQQEPIDVKGRLYTKFKTYDGELPKFRMIKSYTDTADTGADFLCSFVYGVTFSNEAYILDALYSDKAMEYTEPETAKLFLYNKVNIAVIESNNGGRGFARNVERILGEYGSNKTVIKWFTQHSNKISRILSASAWVMEHVYFPIGWKNRWPMLYEALMKYQRQGKNEHDDAPDALSGIYDDLAQRKFEPKQYFANYNL